MWIELPKLWIAVINCLGIPAAHLGIAWASTRVPATAFNPDGLFFRTGWWERGGRLYERLFLVRRWKHLLPDAAPWFRGFAKGQLRSTDPAYLKTFATETCRGESSHWIQLLVIGSFILWTPFPAALVIIAWSLLSNLPCIINLRLTRIRIQALRRRRQR